MYNSIKGLKGYRMMPPNLTVLECQGNGGLACPGKKKQFDAGVSPPANIKVRINSGEFKRG